jgi:hypothetical protein
MKKILMILSMSLSVMQSFSQDLAQIRVDSSPEDHAATTSLAFLDGASNSDENTLNHIAKGILFPKIDLTQPIPLIDSESLGDPDYNPNYYDGLLVYNIGEGPIPETSMGSAHGFTNFVTPGFYYYQNISGYIATDYDIGIWIPLQLPEQLVFSSDDGSISPTMEYVNEIPEFVLRTIVHTDGTTATLNLSFDSGVTSGLLPNDVIEFRGAKIFDDITGDLVFTGGTNYNKTTNVFTTGNGMINYSLPEGNYRVDIRFSSTTLLQDPVSGP